jgi:hypothetical protein
LKTEEAITLLKEMSNRHLVHPVYVEIEQRKPDSYQLKIKSSYDLELIEAYVNYKNLAVKEDIEKKFLIIFKP